MADDGSDLISNISVTGGDEAVSALQDVGDKGAAALTKLSDAASTASDNIAKASTDITSSMGAIGNAAPSTASADRLTAIENAARNVGSAVRESAGDIASFATRLGGLAAVAGGAIVGLAKFAQSITAATRAPTDLTEELTRQQELVNKQNARNVTGTIQYDNSLRDLNKQLTSGTLDYIGYNDAVKKLNQSYDDQRRVHQALQEAMRQTLEENQKLQIQAAQTEAVNHLVKLYGTDLAHALITLGNDSLSVQKQLRDAFGPVLAGLVQKVIDLIDKNRGVITDFINTTAASLQHFIDTSGPSIDAVSKAIGEFGKAALQVVKSILIPAFNAFMATLTRVADFINATFGTHISGQFLLILFVVLQLTGGFTALFSIFQIGHTVLTLLTTLMGGPFAIAIVAITALLVALYFAVDWSALGAKIQNTFNTLKAAASDSINAVIGFFTAFPGNLQIIWDSIVAAAAAMWDKIKQGANDLVSAASDLATQIANYFTNAWKSITDGATNMWTKVKGYFDDLIQLAKTLIGLQQSADSSSGGDGGGSVPVGHAKGGHIIGPGSWTSDSIPIWASHNEFMMQAKAVAKYGVGFMKAINSGAFDLGSTIAGFAGGGLIAPTVPFQRFATGGGINSKQSRVLNLTIAGETFAGLTMPDSVADKMAKFAVAKQVSSAGRKPSWVGASK